MHARPAIFSPSTAPAKSGITTSFARTTWGRAETRIPLRAFAATLATPPIGRCCPSTTCTAPIPCCGPTYGRRCAWRRWETASQYYRDGRLIFDFTDSAPYTRGRFGFRTTQSHVELRRFRVYRIAPSVAPGSGAIPPRLRYPSRRCSFKMHRSITTSKPACSARRAASS